jgi:hypothetical protein
MAALTRALLLLLVVLGAPGAVRAVPEEMSRDEIIDLAVSGVDYSYWWGNGCWRLDGTQHGSCSGSCPDCTHSGSYGADCSGYAAKVWQVPSPSPVTTCSHPYSTEDFTCSETWWDPISRDDLERGDAASYRTGGCPGSGGHIVIYESGDPWGSLWTYEARGCSYGIVHNTRTLSDSYRAIRRQNLGGPTCVPAAEACNGADDDCDGSTDEDLARSCGTDEGACAAGTEWCAEGAYGPCEGEIGPTDEVCEGSVDENCDGMTDEGCDCTAGATRPCGTDEGACAAGLEECDAGGWWGPCVGSVEPAGEECNAVDDDCDGVTDEEIARPCGTDEGACVAGTETCAEGAFGPCQGAIGPTDEVCEGAVDENCDGATDEGCSCEYGATRACGTEEGACTRGLQACAAEGLWGPCVGGVGPVAETCNGIDDDCDGTTDEEGCGADAGDGGRDAPPDGADPGLAGGCDCRLASRPPAGPPLVLLLASLVAARLRRRHMRG